MKLPIASAVLFLSASAVLSGPPQKDAAAPQERSVKPGINDTWKSTNIEPLINTLETESREIYHEREKLAAVVGLRPGAAVADVGSGSGFMTLLFAKQVGPDGRVFAVDINPKLLELVVKRAKQDGLSNLTPIVAKDDSAELPPNSVDLAFICDTYHHFEYPQSTMRSIHRALRPGGQLVVVDFHRNPGKSPAWMMDHVRAGQEVFTQEIVSAGFELTNVHSAPWLKDNYILRFRKVEKPAAWSLPIRPVEAQQAVGAR
jgi:ubiquinone/menaquinone biosynthesis C-methylase UbiE